MSEPLTPEEEAQWRSWLASGHMSDRIGSAQAHWIARLLATLDATRNLAEPLWRVAEAARKAWAAAEFEDGGFDGECVDYLVPIPAMDALRAALADLDANVEETP